MAVIQVKIIDKFGTVLETKEIQDFQLETYKQAGYNVTTLEEAQIEITPEVLNLISQIESGELTVPQNFIDVEVINVKNGNITSERFMRQFNQLLNAGIISTGTQITSYNYSTPYGTFRADTETEQEAFQQKEAYVQEQSRLEAERVAQAVAQAKAEAEQKDQEQQTQIDDLQTQIENISTTTTPVEDIEVLNEKINPNSVRLCGKNFDIESGKIKGQITLEKNSGLWNPYYNDIPLALVVQYMDINTNVTLDLVPHVVTFSQGMQPLIQNIERSTAFGISNYARIKIEVFLWKSLDNPIPFSETLRFVLDADKEPIDICSSKPSIKRDDFMSKAVGIFGGLLGVSLLISGNRKV
tara:strand:- start:213 stop:1277 length:1065 start_codon:yes stop_codon:yes gene_type:complete